MNPSLTISSGTAANRRYSLAAFQPNTIRQAFVLKNPRGLHCRPAAILVKTLKYFNCEATVDCNGAKADPRSILSLMSLAAGFGSKLNFKMTGVDAPAAMTAVEQIFADGFAAAYIEQNRFDRHDFN